MYKRYLQVEIEPHLLAEFELINMHNKVNPSNLIQRWIKHYIEANEDAMKLYDDAQSKEYKEYCKQAREKLRNIYEGLLHKNISAAGRLFILWNKENDYSSEIFDQLARTWALEEEFKASNTNNGRLEKEEWYKWLTENSRGLPYDSDFKAFSDSIFHKKFEKDSYLEFCREQTKDDAEEKVFYFPGVKKE